jgi:RHS repeat-associated protein
MVKLVDGSNTIQENEYDARRFRTLRKDYSDGVLSETRHFYYSAGWRSLEERVGSSTSASNQHIWGLRSIDDLVLRDRDTTGNGTLEERLYALQDSNRNVVAIIDDAGTVQERYSYHAYGDIVFLDSAYASRTSSNFGWNTLFSGYSFDVVSSFYAVRFRLLNPAIGTWLQRDPIAYVESMNMYAYTTGNPMSRIDSLGLQSSGFPPGTTHIACKDGSTKTFGPNTSPSIIKAWLRGHPGCHIVPQQPGGMPQPLPDKPFGPFKPRKDPGRKPTQCEKCLADGTIVPDKEKIAKHTKLYKECIEAVDVKIGQRLEDAKEVYERTRQLIEEEGEKLLRACEEQFDPDSILYWQKVYACQRLVYAAMAANRAAAITVYTEMIAALGIAAHAGHLQCASLYPCHR